MPTFVPEDAVGGPVLQGLAADGGFRIDGQVYPAALLTATAVTAWRPPAIEALTVDDLAPLLTATPEFVLLGTGATLRRPPAALAQALDAQGIGLELMDSRAAARAWVIVRSEGREAVAALMDYRD